MKVTYELSVHELMDLIDQIQKLCSSSLNEAAIQEVFEKFTEKHLK